ncbi:hypothetical protein ACFVHQ_12510 [Actinomycetes bacterium NPDC127524]
MLNGWMHGDHKSTYPVSTRLLQNKESLCRRASGHLIKRLIKFGFFLLPKVFILIPE